MSVKARTPEENGTGKWRVRNGVKANGKMIWDTYAAFRPCPQVEGRNNSAIIPSTEEKWENI